MTAIWLRSLTPGGYVSSCRRYTAQLRPAGFYPEFGCKLTRHYAIRCTGDPIVIGTARTLAEARETYLH